MQLNLDVYSVCCLISIHSFKSSICIVICWFLDQYSIIFSQRFPHFSSLLQIGVNLVSWFFSCYDALFMPRKQVLDLVWSPFYPIWLHGQVRPVGAPKQGQRQTYQGLYYPEQLDGAKLAMNSLISEEGLKGGTIQATLTLLFSESSNL